MNQKHSEMCEGWAGFERKIHKKQLGEGCSVQSWGEARLMMSGSTVQYTDWIAKRERFRIKREQRSVGFEFWCVRSVVREQKKNNFFTLAPDANGKLFNNAIMFRALDRFYIIALLLLSLLLRKLFFPHSHPRSSAFELFFGKCFFFFLVSSRRSTSWNKEGKTIEAAVLRVVFLSSFSAFCLPTEGGKNSTLR